ncbi:MAG: hypothetical protein KDA61_08035 [Planctomycetales bacterium]|nr:hypothetical protein [Planctomycetales bacterium]
MQKHLAKSYGFFKSTAIGGLIFLLPLAVVLMLLGYVYNTVLLVYEPLKTYLPVQGALGLALLFLAAVGILVCICFFAGLAAQRALGRKFSEELEKQLVTIFPKYAIYKDILAGNLGGGELAPTLRPIAVRLDDMTRLGYEAGRTAAGTVIVYLPGSPDPWIGEVSLVAPERVEPLAVSFAETAAICERLGRDSANLLAGVKVTDSYRNGSADSPER